MIDIKFLDLRMDKVVIRFYIMMAGVLILGFSGLWTLAAIWGGTMALGSILGLRINFRRPNFSKNLRKKGKLSLSK